MNLLSLAISALFPKLPSGIVQVVTEVLPDVVDLVRTLSRQDSVAGVDKKKAVISAVRDLLDGSLGNSIPKWKDLPEDRQDRILDGLAELVYFIVELEQSGKTGKTARRASTSRRPWPKQRPRSSGVATSLVRMP